jgi:hypothetical protein
MDVALVAVAEGLAGEFGDVPSGAVARIVTECADEFPNDGPHFIEQAARARLSALRTPEAPDLVRRRDALDVSLEDDELRAETELTTHLIIAASEAELPLSQDDVDALLGV